MQIALLQTDNNTHQHTNTHTHNVLQLKNYTVRVTLMEFSFKFRNSHINFVKLLTKRNGKHSNAFMQMCMCFLFTNNCCSNAFMHMYVFFINKQLLYLIIYLENIYKLQKNYNLKEWENFRYIICECRIMEIG